MVGGRFHQETKTGILDFEVRLGSASSLLELCPRRKARQTGNCFARERETEGWCFPYGLFVLVVAVVFFLRGVGGSICYFLSLASGNVLGLSEVMMKI